MAQVATRTRIIDGDGHVIEGDGLAKFLPPPYTGVGPLRSLRLFPALDHLHNEPVLSPPGSFTPAGPEEWAEFLEDVGIESTVLYPTSALAYGNVTSRDWAIALCKAYNDWLADSYLKRSPRFKGMAIIPMQDVEAAVEELRRAVQELGMLGAMLPSNGLKGNLGAKEFWPVYAEADRLGCSIAVHGGAHFRLGLDHLDVYPPIHALGHPFGLMISCAGILFNGIFDKFPNVRIAFLEGGVAWLLLVLERFNSSYETHVPHNPRGEILRLGEKERVSDYMKKLIDDGRFFVGCEGDEPDIAHAVKIVGNKAFLYSSDYPHEVNKETCKEEIKELLENEALTQQDKEAILYRNAERFYFPVSS